MAKFGLIRRVWTPLKAGFPSCSAANGTDTSNDDEDEVDNNTMFSTRSELNTIATIENVTEIEYVQARCPESRNWYRHSVKISHTEIYWGLCTLSKPKNSALS